MSSFLYDHASFLYDHIVWDLMEDKTIGGKPAVVPRLFPLNIRTLSDHNHPIVKNIFGYLDTICQDLGFKARLSYFSNSFVWDLSPLIHAEEDCPYPFRFLITYRNLENPSTDMGPISFSNDRPTPFVEMEFYESGAVLRSTTYTDLAAIPIRGTFRLYNSPIPLFRRIEGRVSISNTIPDLMESTNMTKLLTSLKQNLMGYISVKYPRFFRQEGDPIHWSIENLTYQASYWSDLFAIESIYRFKKPRKEVITFRFCFSHTTTADVIEFLPYTNRHENDPSNPGILLWNLPIQDPWNNYTDLDEQQELYMNCRLSNMRYKRTETIFELPTIIAPSFSEEVSNNYHLAIFGENNLTLRFYTGNQFPESKRIENLDDPKEGFINIQIKPEKHSLFKNYFHKNLLSESYYIANPSIRLKFPKIIKIQDYGFPRNLTLEDAKIHFNKIRQDIQETLDKNPTWDYIPLSGIDIMDDSFDHDDDCIYNMLYRDELSRYTIIWGNASRIISSPSMDRKQLHKHPVPHGGNNTVWII